MARYNDGLIPASPTVVSGVTAFGTHVNPFLTAALSGFSGATRSDSATAGHVWAKEVSGGYELNLFVGSATDVPLGTVTTATEQYALPVDVIEAGLTSSGRGMPTGAVIMHAANTAPTGYLKCNGAAISRTTYAALFSAIGTTYGVGNGSTTFNVPDLRGEFVRGWDDGRGVDSGRVFGSAQTDDFKSHAHGPSGGGLFVQTPGAQAPGLASGSVFGGDGIGRSGTTASTGGSETRPRNLATLFCIKF